jgi:MFS family permease
LRNDIATGLRLAFADPMLRVNAIFGCLSNFMLTGYQAILLVFLVTTVHLEPGTAGVLLALASVGGVIGAAFARRIARAFGSARGWLICKLGLAPFGLLIPLTTHGAGLVLFVLGSMAMIGGIVAGNVIWSGFVQTYYPSDMLGRITTSIQFVNFGAIPLGALTAGALAEALDPRTALWIMLAGVAASGCVLLLSPVRPMRDLPTATDVTGRVPRTEPGDPSCRACRSPSENAA